MMEEITGIRCTQEFLVIDQEEFNSLWIKAIPSQRLLSVTLPVTAVFKDGKYYIPHGALAWKTTKKSDG